MTTRDRLTVVGLAVLALLAGVWFMTVSPERKQAAKVNTEVQAARQQLASAETQAAEATNARTRYSSAYASLVSLGQAVPASAETPALIYMLDRATHSRDVQFSSISSGASASGGSSASTTTPTTQTTGFTQESFTFVFNGGFVGLYKLLAQLEGFTVQTPSGTVRVSGRLLTINGVSLAPASEAGNSNGQLTGTITATAYVLPPGQSALAGATPSAPAGATAPASGSSGSSATAAVVKVTP